MKSAFRFLQLAAITIAIGLASPAQAVTEINWWHAMSGELGKQVEKLAADFNASQSDYRIVPTYKGNYTETVTSAIFAFRSRSQPAIVQVNEIATACSDLWRRMFIWWDGIVNPCDVDYKSTLAVGKATERRLSEDA